MWQCSDQKFFAARTNEHTLLSNEASHFADDVLWSATVDLSCFLLKCMAACHPALVCTVCSDIPQLNVLETTWSTIGWHPLER